MLLRCCRAQISPDWEYFINTLKCFKYEIEIEIEILKYWNIEIFYQYIEMKYIERTFNSELLSHDP